MATRGTLLRLSNLRATGLRSDTPKSLHGRSTDLAIRGHYRGSPPTREDERHSPTSRGPATPESSDRLVGAQPAPRQPVTNSSASRRPSNGECSNAVMGARRSGTSITHRGVSSRGCRQVRRPTLLLLTPLTHSTLTMEYSVRGFGHPRLSRCCHTAAPLGVMTAMPSYAMVAHRSGLTFRRMIFSYRQLIGADFVERHLAVIGTCSSRRSREAGSWWLRTTTAEVEALSICRARRGPRRERPGRVREAEAIAVESVLGSCRVTGGLFRFGRCTPRIDLLLLLLLQA